MFLQDHFQFDNTDFLNQMKNEGFWIDNSSLSNYPWTIYSIASSLNLNYINDRLTGEKIHDFLALKNIINQNKIHDFLCKNGYSLSNIKSASWPTECINSADKIFFPEAQLKGYFLISWLKTTILAHLFIPDTVHKTQVNKAFKLLKESIKYPHCPCYVFCHILCPHKPYLFKLDGIISISNYFEFEKTQML